MEASECSSQQGPFSNASSPRARKPASPSKEHTSKSLTNELTSTSGCEADQGLLRQLEASVTLNLPPSYLRRRAALLSWLLEVQGELGVRPLTVHSCVLLMDRFASTMSVPESLLQLLLVACLHIAVKVENEEGPVSAATLSQMTDDTYSPAMISQMEAKVLSALQWKLAPVTTARFLDLFLADYCRLWGANCDEEANVPYMRDTLGKLVDLCMLEPHFLQFRPSLLAATLLYIGHSRIMEPQGQWSSELVALTSYNVQDMAICFTSLQRIWVQSTLMPPSGRLETKSMDTRVSPRTPLEAAAAFDSCSESGDDTYTW